MAIPNWFSKLINGQESEEDAKAEEGPDMASPEPTQELQSLQDELAAMRPAAANWCTSEPPSADPEDSREWLLQEVSTMTETYGASSGVVKLSERLTETLKLPDLSLPPSPSTSLQLFSLLSDEKVSIHNVQNVIKQDPALLKQVWLKANSAHFATPPKDIQYAIARIGFHDLGRLAASAVVSARAFRTYTYRSASKKVRERCLVSSELIQRYGRGNRSNTFLSGLMHGVGSFIVLRAATVENESLSQLMPRILAHLEAPLGLLALSRWRMPKGVVYSVGYQAAPSSAPEQHQALARLCRASSIAVHGAQGMKRGHNYGAFEALETLLQGQSIDPEHLLSDAVQLLAQHRARG